MKTLKWRIKVELRRSGSPVSDLGHSLDLVAVHIGSCVGDTAVEDSEWGREGLADGFRIRAEGLNLVSSRVVDGDELCHAFQDGLVGLGEDPIADSCRGAGGAVRM